MEPIQEDTGKACDALRPEFVNIHQPQPIFQQAADFRVRPCAERLDFLKVGFKLVFWRGQGKLLRLGQRLAGTPLPGGGLLSLQLLAHGVECADVGQLHAESLLAHVAHNKEQEAVKKDGVHGARLALFIRVFRPAKIGGAKCFRAVSAQVTNISQSFVMRFAEVFGNGN